MSFTVVPVLFATGSDPLVITILAVIVPVPVLVFFVWVGLYHKSMWYEHREDEMSWKRGVWLQTTGIVPYQLITNIDVRQGPVMRVPGISTRAVRTAGYFGQAVPEFGSRAGSMQRSSANSSAHSYASREQLVTGQGGAPPRAPAPTDQKLPDELVKIRQLLEGQRK